MILDKIKVYIPMLDSLSWWSNHFEGNKKGRITEVGKIGIHPT